MIEKKEEKNKQSFDLAPLKEVSDDINAKLAERQELKNPSPLEKKRGNRKAVASDSLDDFLSNLSAGSLAKNTEYWDSLTIKNHFECFQRWVFAICSVHTTWEMNVRGYNHLMSDLSWTLSKEGLEQVIKTSGLGMYHRRNRGLWELIDGFRSNPDEFYKQDDETWVEARNRLVGRIFGLGYAKTTFALTLSFPTQAQLVCLDVHILRFMGHDKDGTPNKAFYLEMEQKWLETCAKYKINPAVAREMYWDRVQNKRSPRYWSYCLEK